MTGFIQNGGVAAVTTRTLVSWGMGAAANHNQPAVLIKRVKLKLIDYLDQTRMTACQNFSNARSSLGNLMTTDLMSRQSKAGNIKEVQWRSPTVLSLEIGFAIHQLYPVTQDWDILLAAVRILAGCTASILSLKCHVFARTKVKRARAYPHRHEVATLVVHGCGVVWQFLAA